MRTLSVSLVLLSLFTLTGCRTSSEPVAAETSTGILVDAEWLAEAIDAAEDVVVLHVARDSTSYRQGHIPGARFLPLSAVAVDRDDQVNVLPDASAYETQLEAAGVSNGSRVVLYGDLDGLAATRAFAAMEAFGHDQVSVLNGGQAAWQSTGRALSTEAPDAVRGSVTPEVRQEIIVTAEQVNELRQDEGTVLVDARPEAQHAGAEPGENITRPGHIPGSVNLFWEDDLNDDGTLLPLDSLRARYDAAGVTDAAEVVTYCRTGMQASHAYFVARYLGLQPRLYDGSFHDWSNNTDFPVTGP